MVPIRRDVGTEWQQNVWRIGPTGKRGKQCNNSRQHLPLGERKSHKSGTSLVLSDKINLAGGHLVRYIIIFIVILIANEIGLEPKLGKILFSAHSLMWLGNGKSLFFCWKLKFSLMTEYFKTFSEHVPSHFFSMSAHFFQMCIWILCHLNQKWCISVECFSRFHIYFVFMRLIRRRLL